MKTEDFGLKVKVEMDKTVNGGEPHPLKVSLTKILSEFTSVLLKNISYDLVSSPENTETFATYDKVFAARILPFAFRHQGTSAIRAGHIRMEFVTHKNSPNMGDEKRECVTDTPLNNNTAKEGE